MTHKNPIGMIKDVATASLKVPVTVAGTAAGLAKGAVGAVGAVVGGDKGTAPAPAEAQPEEVQSADGQSTDVEIAADEQESAADEPKIEISPDEPVNVTEELGLDPAPVEKPKRKKPVTKIDAAADPSEVDVTPADVAKNVGQADLEQSPGQG